jgi:hypothetical protein
MTTAKPCNIVGDKLGVVITHGSGVRTTLLFNTEAEAKHYFLDQLGWYEEKGVWYDHEAILPSFVPVPRFSHGQFVKNLFGSPARWTIGIWTTWCSVAGIQGSFYAFYYQMCMGHAFGVLDFDPILSIASPFPLKIGAIGAWSSVFLAGEAAQTFYEQLLETYGHEYFRRVVDENVRRELSSDEARHQIALDAETQNFVGGSSG